jgi:hypothetical protein
VLGDSAQAHEAQWQASLNKELQALLEPLGVRFVLDAVEDLPLDDALRQKLSQPISVYKPEDTQHGNALLQQLQALTGKLDSVAWSSFGAVLAFVPVRIQWRPHWAHGDSLRLEGSVILPWRDAQGNVIRYVGCAATGRCDTLEVKGYPAPGVLQLRRRDSAEADFVAHPLQSMARLEEEEQVFALPRAPQQQPLLVISRHPGGQEIRRIARALVREWAAQVGIPVDGGPENALSPLPHEQRERLVWTAKQWRVLNLPQ